MDPDSWYLRVFIKNTHSSLTPGSWEPSESSSCQARFFRYLHLRGLADTSSSRVWQRAQGFGHWGLSQVV